jgi:glycosyltransferase involved in cell wall biosynthesis
VRLLKKHGTGFVIRKTWFDFKEQFRERTSGINIAGYISYILGNGETARSFARIIDRLHIPFALIDLFGGNHPLLSAEDSRCFDFRLVRKPRFDTTLIFANGNVLKDVYDTCPGLTQSRRKAAVWWWEFEDGMDCHLPGFDYIDEIVVFSEFTKRAVGRILPEGKKLTRLPYPFYPDWEITADRTGVLNKFGIEADRTVFYFNFDFASSYQRKNPEGILKAYQHAFGCADKVHMIIKTTNHDWFPLQSADFGQIVSRHPLKENITWINRAMPHTDHYRLLSAIDCYVSLHRGEGLGLGMLEAMYLGKTVIATNYGGNMEFTASHNSLLVKSTMVPCGDDYVIYRNVSLWAEPDIDQAADYMRMMHDNPDARIEIGGKARQEIIARYDPDNCSEPYRKWIDGKFL